MKRQIHFWWALLAVLVVFLAVLLPAARFQPAVKAQSQWGNFFCAAAPGGSQVNGQFGFDLVMPTPTPHLGDSIFAAGRIQLTSAQPNHVSGTITLQDPNGVTVGTISKTFFLARGQNGQFQLSIPTQCNWPAGSYTFTMTVTGGNGSCGVFNSSPPPPVATGSVLVLANSLCGL